ncbi:MAG TPA: hypothetical protein VGI40_16440 [Pirellulaceae bacterium]|jgi:hypothetical protein
MWLRFLTFAALICLASIALAQDNIANPDGKEWQVIYDPVDIPNDGDHFKKSKSPVGDIRLRIYQDNNAGGAYKADIRLFDKNHVFLGRAENVPLQVGGGTTGRQRFGFWIDKTTLSNGSSIRLNGIWQHGLNTRERTAQRIQLRWHYYGNPAPAKAKGGKMGDGGCEDDPDSDVLEEGDAPPDDPPDQPPEDPTPPCP